MPMPMPMPKTDDRRARTLRVVCILAVLFGGAAFAAAGSPADLAEPGSAAGREADVETLLDGVAAVGTVGVPGPLVCFGDAAFPVVVGESGGVEVAVVVAAHAGRGRLVAFGHGGYGAAATLRSADTGRFMMNAIEWSAGRKAARGRPLRVAIWKGDGLTAPLSERGHQVGRLELDGVVDLREVDVVCCFTPELSKAAVTALESFVRGGGGLILAQTAWGWSQVHGGADVRDNPLNALVGPFGLAWMGGTASTTGPGVFVVSGPPDRLIHGGAALAALVDDGTGTAPLEADRRKIAAASATSAARFLPTSDRSLRRRLDGLVREAGDRLVPSPARPLSADRALDRVLLAHQLGTLAALPPERTPAHPAGAEFPGAVPRSARAVQRSIEIDLGRPRWHGTGLYAVAGRPLIVQAPAALADAGASLRIGCHTDRLWNKEQWRRVPEISRAWPLAAGRNIVASPFGGLIYVDVPGGRRGTVLVEIQGGVPAPRFVLGKTPVDDWRRTIRDAPAPWAELETEKVVVTVPSGAVRDLDDPTAVLEVWDRVLDAAADLAAIPRERPRPERYVADEQISAGYMHSGYPIMTHLDAVSDMTRVDRLSAGAWGLFHELGHNHQDGQWTFSGTGEVTCNLFSLYIGETVCGLGPRDGHPALARREPRMARHFAEGAAFERWKSQPFLALAMYQELQETFGWAPFKAVFAEYRDLGRSDRPRTDAEKRDQWMARFSTAVGRNLAPFFARWGVPISPAAAAAVEALPPWFGPPGAPGVVSPEAAETGDEAR